MAEVHCAAPLDFNKAMDDFTRMFPEMDPEIIEAVLRANEGAVHATIDQLLGMNADMATFVPVCLPSESACNHLTSEQPPSYALSATPPPPYHQAVPLSHRSLGMIGADATDSGNGPLCRIRNWTPSVVLSLTPDFLRIMPNNDDVEALSPYALSRRIKENALARKVVGEKDAELAQFLQDERVALFLQNDEFMNELRADSEFLNSLQRDSEDDELDLSDLAPGAKMTSSPPLDDATLRARIATMGKTSWRKFAQIAKVFSRKKRGAGGARTLLPTAGGAAKRDFLLVSSDPLIDDDEDDEDAPEEPRGALPSSSAVLQSSPTQQT